MGFRLRSGYGSFVTTGKHAAGATPTSVPIATVVISPGRRLLRDVTDLARSIQEVGLLSPIIVTPTSQLVAGRQRLEACRRLGWERIPVRVVLVSDLHRELIEIDENVARVELTVLERAQALAKRRDIYHALHPEVRPVREKGGPGRGRRNTGAKMAAVRPFAEDAASRAGVSSRTVWRLVEIAERLDSEAAKVIAASPIANSTTDLVRLSRMDPVLQRDVARLLSAGTGTIKAALRQLRWRTLRLPGAKAERGEHYRLLTGDGAAEMKNITDGSIGLVIADPPWSARFAARLPDLAGEIRRVLRPGGHALIIIGQQHLPALFAAVGPHLRYKWMLCLRQSKPKQNWRGSALSVWLPVVVFERPGPKRTYDFRWDVLDDDPPSVKSDPWSKSARVLGELVDWASVPGDVVLDPFCGSGSTGVAAVRLGRRFVGVDIDPAAIRLAASRLATATWADPQLAPQAEGRAAYPV